MHTNYDNRNFYELSPENSIRNAARCAGLLSNIDIEIVLRYIEVEVGNTIIDLGAGEGRVIAHLLERGYPGHISGVEYAKQKYKALAREFNQIDRVSILHENMMDLNGSYDYGLLLFSVILDFTKEEQEKLIINLDKIIGRRLFIDMPKFNAEKNGTYLPNQTAVIEMEWGRLEGFFPKKDDLLDFFQNTSFHLQKIEAYITDTKRERELFVFSK